MSEDRIYHTCNSGGTAKSVYWHAKGWRCGAWFVKYCPFCGEKLERPKPPRSVSLEEPRLCYTCTEYQDCKRSEPSCWKLAPPATIEVSRKVLKSWLDTVGLVREHMRQGVRELEVADNVAYTLARNIGYALED